MLIARSCVIASAIACFAISNASAQAPRDREWVQLGCYEVVRAGTDFGQIRVDARNSDLKRFTAIRLSSTGAHVYMQSLSTVFASGTTYDMDPRINLRDGQNASVDLPGNSHEVRLINFRFQSTLQAATPRTICAEGRVARVQPNWRELGCHTVDFRKDIDVIPVRADATYEAIRLTAYESAVFIQNFKVKHGGSSVPEAFIVNTRIPQDISTRRFPLLQEGQRIREIELSYRTAQGQASRALVCAEGLVVAERPQDRPQPLQVGWIELGCHTVDTNGGSGEIKVGREKGYFRAIQVRARDNDVRLQALEVIRLNGERTGMPESDRIDRNAPPRQLLFGDRAHHIDRIEMRYRPASRGDAQAFLCIDGQIADAPPQNERRDDRRGDRKDDRQDDRRDPQNVTDSGDWKLIGCQPVQTSRETDVYLIGRDEGTYRAIRFVARRNDVRLRNVRITFSTGDSEQFSMSEGNESTIRRDEPTREIVLGGDQRVIQRIEMNYRSAGGEYRGEALLCIQGQPGRSRTDDGNYWRREPINLRQ